MTWRAHHRRMTLAHIWVWHMVIMPYMGIFDGHMASTSQAHDPGTTSTWREDKRWRRRCKEDSEGGDQEGRGGKEDTKGREGKTMKGRKPGRRPNWKDRPGQGGKATRVGRAGRARRLRYGGQGREGKKDKGVRESKEGKTGRARQGIPASAAPI